MNSLIRYCFAGFVLFGTGLAVEPSIRPQQSIPDRTAPEPAIPSRDVSVRVGSVEVAIAAALATHGNAQELPLSYFTDLIRSMEKNGVRQESAIQVAVALAKNPKLDNLAGLTIVGSLQRYQETTSETLDDALVELMTYIEQPDRSSRRAAERVSLLSLDEAGQIDEKISDGNQVAAERLIERALLRRFNPSLADRIFVPSTDVGSMQATVSPAQPVTIEPRRQAQRPAVLPTAAKRSAPRRVVIAHAAAARGHSSAGCCLRRISTRR